MNVSVAQPSERLWEVLRAAQRAGRVVRSLEKAETLLAAEARGLRMADRKTGKPRGERISRLLILAADGAERFYRRSEALVRQNGPRVAAVCLAADAQVLGSMLFGPGSSVRLVMVEHKESVGEVLLALADQWALSPAQDAAVSSP